MGFAALNPSYTLDVPAILIPRFDRKDVSGITNTCLERAARSCASAALDGLEGALAALRESHPKRIKNLRLQLQVLLSSRVSIGRRHQWRASWRIRRQPNGQRDLGHPPSTLPVNAEP
jgi:hypothetical protein